MAAIRMDGVEYPLPDAGDWTVGELSEAENALGVSFGDKSQGDSMAVSFYIAVRRVDKETMPVALADKVKNVKMSQFDVSEDEEQAPLETPFGPAESPTSGPRLSEASG